MEDLPGDRPMKYLVDIEEFLNDGGGLKGADALPKFLLLLKKAKKMVPRCLLLHILNASEKNLKSQFCESDGWLILSAWLKEAKEESNDSFIRQILVVLKSLPVNVSVLKSSSCAKVVKQLAKLSPEVSSVVPPLARDLVSQWMGTINESFLTKSKEDKKEKEHHASKKHRHHESSAPEPPLKKRKKDKERKRHDSEGSDGHGHVSKKEKRVLALEDINSKSAVAEKQRKRELAEKEDPEAKQRKRELAEKEDPEAKQRKRELAEKEDPEAKQRKRELAEKEDPEAKHRKRSTVKMLPQRMRTAGIEDSAEKAVATKSRSEVLAAKKEKLEKPGGAEAGAPSIESMHQTIKVNVTGHGTEAPAPAEQRSPKNRRASHEIHESNSFMNALNAAVGPTVIRKKKKSSATSPTSKVKPEVSAKPEGSDKAKPKEEDAVSDCSNDSQGPKKSALAEIGSLITKKSAKKSVTWADEDNLREVRYFELDETERVNVNRLGSMEEMARKEHLLERQLFSRNAAGQQGASSDSGSSSPYEKGWYRPFSLEGQSCTTEMGKNSREVAIQAERERHVLAALYFSKESVPDSAQEPDTAHEDYVDPVIVPLEDQTILEAGASSEASAAKEGEESAKATSPSGSPSGDANSGSASKVLMSNQNEFSLTPEVASLLKSITAGLAQPGAEERSPGDAPKLPNLEQPPPNRPKGPGSFKGGPIGPQQAPYNEKVWRVLRDNYPNLNLNEISVDRMRQLLEPIQDQLRACGALNSPNSYGMHGPNGPNHGHGHGPSGPSHGHGPNGSNHGHGPSGPSHGHGPNGPNHGPGPNGPNHGPGPNGPNHGPGPNGPNHGHGPNGPNHGPGPNGPGPNGPGGHGPPGPYGPGGPRSGMHGPPPHRPPHPQFGPNGPPPHPMGPPQGQRFPPGYGPQGPRHYGPPMPPHRPPPYNTGPPPPNGHYGGGGGGKNSNRVCRYYQNGACRSGNNCRFVHSHNAGPSHSPQDS